MSRHGGGGYEELDAETTTPRVSWQSEGLKRREGETLDAYLNRQHAEQTAGGTVSTGAKESVLEAATELPGTPTEANQGISVDEWAAAVARGFLADQLGDYGRCLCGHLDDDHDDACTVFDCECEDFETDGTDLNADGVMEEIEAWVYGSKRSREPATAPRFARERGGYGYGNHIDAPAVPIGVQNRIVEAQRRLDNLMPQTPMLADYERAVAEARKELEDAIAALDQPETPEGAEIIVERSGWNDPDGYHQSVRKAVRCRYCQSTTHRGSAWTSRGDDVERFERLHRDEDGRRPGGDSY